MRIFNFACAAFLLLSFHGFAQQKSVKSPDGKLSLSFDVVSGKPVYEVDYDGSKIVERSPLGLQTNEGDFSEAMKFLGSTSGQTSKSYTNERIKTAKVSYQANVLRVHLENKDGKKIAIVFNVSNNNVGFKYDLPTWGERLSCVIQKEFTGFRFPTETTTFLSPMMPAMTSFGRSAPSYESPYEADMKVGQAKSTGDGFVFPGLFHVGDKGWALVSETGVRSTYCASHLSDPDQSGTYSVDYPNMDQNNGFGTSGAAISLPGSTPWRTITIGNNLKPIVETTIPFDLVDPLFEPSQQYKFGRSTWSWILWQDNSLNYDDQIQYIDLAASLGFEYVLIDGLWDKQIGVKKVEELIRYAQSKKVDVFLWYNSNGAANDAPQGPRNRMNISVERKQEMKWIRQMGVKGLKVDFFGGDKQETMRLYEDILSDANDFGLMVIFHGATLPRGWEVMYPNFIGSEAVLASEMLIFFEHIRKAEAFNAALHPFIRNSVGSMEFGGLLLNKYLTRSNTKDNKRLTTDAFQLATGVLFQNPVQVFALAPNNLTDVPAFELDLVKEIPTTWDETVFIDGYPGKYVVLARRKDDKWFVSGVNAEKKALKLKLDLPMLAGKSVTIYNDKTADKTEMKYQKINANGSIDLTILSNGGFVIKN